jgi:hypothetical protein
MNTPTSDAILGIDATGSYFVALRETTFLSTAFEERQNASTISTQSDLALCLLALPSKAMSKAMRSPCLLLNVPLVGSMSSSSSGTNRASWMVGAFVTPAPARVPVRIWLSGPLGACLYRPTVHSSDDETPCLASTGTVLFFPTPSAQSRPTHGDEGPSLVVVHKLCNVHLPCQLQLDESTSKGTNMLWRVSFVPTYRDTDHLVSNVKETTERVLCAAVVIGKPSYCFLIDEEDGYRLTWIAENNMGWSSTVPETRRPKPLWRSTPTTVIRATSRIVSTDPVDDMGWETMIFDRYSGELHQMDSDRAARTPRPHFSISYTAFLSVPNLLADILNRRPKLVQPPYNKRSSLLFPSFSSHLVGLNCTGQSVELLLVFAVGNGFGQGCCGVFVEVDLLTQDYKELEWIRHKDSDIPPSSCESLALERRRRQLFEHAPTTDHRAESYSGYQPLVCESASGHDQTLGRLYPDCQTMDNLAVRRHIPIQSLSALSAPVEMTYC